jgi:hypothetical protein
MNPVLGTNALAYLTLLALILVSPHPPQIPGTILDLSTLVAVQLTPEQEQGKRYLLEKVGDYHPAYLIAVGSALWDGVCHLAHSHALTAELTQHKSDLEFIASDEQLRLLGQHLRISMRLLGLQQMCTEQSDAFYESTDLL